MDSFNNLRIQSKLFGIFGLTILIAALITMWNVFGVIRIHAEAGEMLLEIEALDDLEEAHIEFLVQDVAEKDFLLSGDHHYVNHHEAASDLTMLYLEEALLESPSAEERRTLLHLEQENEKYQMLFASVVEKYEAGDMDGAIALSLGESDASIERVHQIVEETVTEGEDRVAHLSNQATMQAQSSLIIAVVGGIIFLILSVLAASSAARQIGQPILAFRDALEATGRGEAEPADLDQYAKRSDEIGGMARALTHMIQATSKHEAELQQRILKLREEIG